jgi:hypothetical protein
VNIFEVTGTYDTLDVNLHMSSKVNDYQLVGLSFGGDSLTSLIAAPYDFKNLVIWSNII